MDGESAKPFLDRLEPADRTALLNRARRVSYNAGAGIIAEGDAADTVFFLLEGEALAVRCSAEGRSVSYRDIVPGDLFGEIAALDGGARTADVLARTACVAGMLPVRAFEAALAASPSLTLAVVRHLARLIRASGERVFEGVTMTVRQRLALDLLRRAADSGAGLRIDPAPTHADVAARIGTHREAVTKELAALTARKLLRRDGRCIEIPDPERLAAEIHDGTRIFGDGRPEF
jgi:CRP-like cAMP-binding protein